MKIIGITQKLKAKSKIEIQEFPDKISNKIDCWHANLYKYGKKTGVIFVNDLTRYSVLLFGITKPQYSEIIDLFLKQLKRNMSIDNFTPEEIEKFTIGFDKVRYTKTRSRSILGTITDFLKFIDYSGEDLNDLNQIIIDELNFSLNDMPVSPLEKLGFTPFPNRTLKEYFREQKYTNTLINTVIDLEEMKMKEKILKKYYKRKRKKFISAVIIDIIGLLSFIIPSLGEWGDVIWAPLSGFLIYLLFPNRKKMAFLGILEEAMPFMDFIPTAYITWRQEYIKDKNETLSKFIYNEVSDQQLVDEVLNTININTEKFSD